MSEIMSHQIMIGVWSILIGVNFGFWQKNLNAGIFAAGVVWVVARIFGHFN